MISPLNPASSSRSTRPRDNLTAGSRVRWALAASIAALGLAISIVGAGIAHATTVTLPTGCTKVASPSGSDAGTGAADAPFGTAQELVDALTPGQVGCLEAGTYPGGLTFRHGGAAGAPLVLRSYPGEEALVTGRVYVAQGANYVTVADLSLDGNYQGTDEPLPSPSIDANDVTFESDDVTNDHTEICFVIGSSTWGTAAHTVIADDYIHDCGVLPATNGDHGIYVADATDTQIVNNVIARNADRGIQLYPDAIGSVITGNVISENGEDVDISGAEGYASSDNTIEHNLIVNSLIRHDVESWYPEGNPVGIDNTVRDNCVSSAGIDTSAGGFTATDNITVSAGELIQSGVGYLVEAGSPCAAMVPSLVDDLEVPTTLSGFPAPTAPESEASTGSAGTESGSSGTESGSSGTESGSSGTESGSSGTSSSPPDGSSTPPSSDGQRSTSSGKPKPTATKSRRRRRHGKSAAITHRHGAAVRRARTKATNATRTRNAKNRHRGYSSRERRARRS